MQSHAQDTCDPTMTKQAERRLMWTYKSLFIIQMSTGLIIIASSSFSFLFDQGEGGVPYYPGGYIIGLLLLISSALAFRVWYRVPHINSNTHARKDVLRAITFHHRLSMGMFLACVIGLCMLLMFGLCLQNQEDCSYEDDASGHRIIASISVVFGFIGIVTSSIGVMLIRQFGNLFGIEDIRARPPVPTVSGDIAINPVIDAEHSQVSEAQRERDSQIQQELQLSPFSAFTKYTEGVTNAAFGMPQLPTYSPPENGDIQLQLHSDEETVRRLQSPPLKDTNRQASDVEQYNVSVPQLPPYSAVDIHTEVPTSSYDNSNIMITVPTEPPPPYVFNSTVEKYMLDQID